MLIDFPLRLLDPKWYHFEKKIREQKRTISREDESGWYFLTLMHRGENLLYTERSGSTYVKVGIRRPCFLASGSIKKWRYLWEISDAERSVVITRVIRYFDENGETCRIV